MPIRPDVRDQLAAWVLGTLALAAACAVLTGCGHSTIVLEPTTPQEVAVVAETAAAAARHHVDVRGEIVDKLSTASDGRAGELRGSVAYFLRAAVNEYPVERMRELAVHEVCHAVLAPDYAHDTAHWCCMKRDDEVGYPPPVTVEGQWPTC